jgi:hypothetical protein
MFHLTRLGHDIIITVCLLTSVTMYNHKTTNIRYNLKETFAGFSMLNNNRKLPETVEQKPNSKIESALIYHFSKYIEWGTKNKGEFVINVIGTDRELVDDLTKMALEKVETDKKIIIVNDLVISDKISIVYLCNDKIGNFKNILNECIANDVLLVTSKKTMASQGSMINIIIKPDGKVGFEVNKNTINKTNIKISNKLLDLSSPY